MLDFLKNEEKEVEKVLLEKILMIDKECQGTEDVEMTEGTSTEGGNKKDDRETAMTFLLGNTANSARCIEDKSGKGEFARFKRESQLHHDECPLVWWKSNHERFPIIAKLARKLLCVPATSVPSEWIFSTAGLIVSNLRSSLNLRTLTC